MGFQTPQPLLKDLLPKIAKGEIQLPDFQRGYVWDEERIRSLLVTIALGHPLGVVMTLQTGNDQVRFKPKPIEGAEVTQGEVEPALLVLDGQQRLTSLSQALWGDGVADTHDTRKKVVQRRFFIDIAQAVKDPGDLDDAVKSLPGDGVVRANFDRDIVLDVSTREKQLEHGYFPANLIYSDQGTSWLFDYADSGAAKAFLDAVVTPMQSYAIPSIELDKETTKDAVATVFEKVNQGGMKLTVFELLTAKFAGDAHYYRETGTDFRLKDDWEETRRVIEKYPVLESIQETEFLQAVMLLASQHGGTATTARKDDILDLSLADYRAWAGQVRTAMEWVAGFLDTEHVHTGRDVPYPPQLVALAALRVLMGEDIDVHGVRAKVRQWYWCGVLGELYSSSTETRLARDVDQVPDWARGADGAVTPRTVDEANFFESRLHSLRTRNAAAYKGIHALLMADGTKDWLHNQRFDRAHYLNLAVDIHHIFPKAWCIKNEIDPEFRESVVNKTPLARKTNQVIGSASPADYMAKLDSRAKIPAAELDAIVAAHQIDVADLRAGSFEAFFTKRREALLRLVESAMGKPAVRDVERDALGGGTESAAAFVDEPDDPEDPEEDDPPPEEE
ncbi:GmrSD restriction endonuclease domain-containing protein [Halostreptopolyspora alba]|uniref:DUF262 domain-containing protein n=1 Tax=Halostreptopolyspora alba TaxID=2487137 RepID=A0A3N0E942_9ACTN|nr:DUF262 domain-containing protein [Nocardiopsaceae bacterium YIM 96095]